jgi:CheY-like chemotaxis protein
VKEATRPNRVLIVDDHPAIRETMNDILNGEGFNTQLAADGKEALNLCLSKDFDFVLIDIQMPEMNGVEVLKQLKEQKEKCPKFIFFSAYSTQELQEMANSLGAYAFLKKPIKVEKILNLIRLKRNISILIHLKDDELRHRISDLLEEKGYMISQTSSHDDALIQIRQINYNCIVFDSDSPSIEQEVIKNTIKSLKSDTLCIETNEDEDMQNLMKTIAFQLDDSQPVFN